ncbi:MAG: GNAT family N-acetyltransferase [Steroidobacteraceae bacterium]
MDVTLRFTPVHTQDQLAQIERLAREIWYEYYVSLVGRAQVDYMVDRFQSVSAIQGQLSEGYEYFLIERLADASCLGYLAILPELSSKALFLSKLYVLATVRGTGVGRLALTFVDDLARTRSAAGLADGPQAKPLAIRLRTSGICDGRIHRHRYRRWIRHG